jgi:hypothetical protein
MIKYSDKALRITQIRVNEYVLCIEKCGVNMMRSVTASVYIYSGWWKLGLGEETKQKLAYRSETLAVNGCDTVFT